MLFDLFDALFKIIDSILNSPTWVVILVIVILAVLYFIGNLFGVFDTTEGNECGGFGGGSNYKESSRPSKNDSAESYRPFVFYDSHNTRCGRDSNFYDSKGDRCSWGGGFHDGKGYYRQWGEDYYDAKGVFRSWGDCFYDAQGNLVYPNE